MREKVALLVLLTVFINFILPSAELGSDAKHPLSLHPDNPHYFLFRGKPTLLITSGEHYGSVLNLDFDFERYFSELQSAGMNLTRLFAGTYRENQGWFNIEQNTLAPAARRYVCPWPRSEVPGSVDGGTKFDLTKFDPAYFARLKEFMMSASNHGVVVEVNLFCPNYNEELWKINPMNAANNVQGMGACGAKEVYALKHDDLTAVQDAVTRKIVQELAGFDNLYFEVCNEPYFGGVTREWQDHIAAVIVDAEKELPKQHLISMNIANGAAKVEHLNPAVSIFNFHYSAPPDTVGMNYGLNKVIGENETGCRGRSDVTYRTEGWDFLLAGGGLYNNLDYSFTTSHPDGTANVKCPGGGSPVLRKQLKTLSEFLNGFDFIHLAPNDNVIKGGLPKELTARVLAEPGKQYAIYVKWSSLGLPPDWTNKHKGEKPAVPEKTKVELQLDLPAGKYRTRWLDPVTGRWDAEQHLQHAGGIAKINSPEFLEDAALMVKAE